MKKRIPISLTLAITYSTIKIKHAINKNYVEMLLVIVVLTLEEIDNKESVIDFQKFQTI